MVTKVDVRQKRNLLGKICPYHHIDVIMGAVASQITSVSIVCSTVCSDADQRNHQSSASLAVVGVNHRWPVNSPHKRPVTRKILPFDDVNMCIWHCIPSTICLMVRCYLCSFTQQVICCLECEKSWLRMPHHKHRMIMIILVVVVSFIMHFSFIYQLTLYFPRRFG